jgi:hypothetical protein
MPVLSETVARVRERIIDIGLANDPLAKTALAISQERGCLLTPRATRLLSLAAESWGHEPPRLRSDVEIDHTSEQWIDLGKRILGRALEDPRLISEMSDLGSVTLPTLLHALSDAGSRELVDLGFK